MFMRHLYEAVIWCDCIIKIMIDFKQEMEVLDTKQQHTIVLNSLLI